MIGSGSVYRFDSGGTDGNFRPPSEYAPEASFNSRASVRRLGVSSKDSLISSFVGDDCPFANASARRRSSHFPLTESMLFATRCVGFQRLLPVGVVVGLSTLFDDSTEFVRDNEDVRSIRRRW
jgi:hypothetical protein